MSTKALEFEINILGSISEETGDATNSANDENNGAEAAEGVEENNEGSLIDSLLPILLAIFLGDDEPEEEETVLWLTNASVQTEFDEQGRPTSVETDSSIERITGKPSELPEVGHHVRITIGYYEPETVEAGTPLVASVSVETSLVQEEEEAEEVENLGEAAFEAGAEAGGEAAPEVVPETSPEPAAE